ncbi:hypothetical protein ACEXQE_11785 [Herbiconiux sp. P17]|uniref:hypothetical protein n=1 Tax=Herbiconiux wuyangfengii TaxID=3342794 RepID=UPI0035B9A84F
MTSDAENTNGPATITAAQGSQPTIAGLRIGVVDAATRDGVSKARLLLRPATGDRAVTVIVGETVEVAGFGTVTLDAVENTGQTATAGSGSAERPRVRLTVTPG